MALTLPYWDAEGTAGSDPFRVEFRIPLNESGVSNDDFADAIRNAIEAMVGVTVTSATAYSQTSASY